MKNASLVVIALIGALALGGCATSRSGAAYSRDQTRQEQSVRMGTVESVRPVQIEGTRTGVGPVAGAVVGGIGGSAIGHGRGSAVGAAVGAVGGAVAGQAIEEAATREEGLEITVKLDNGQMIAIAQEADETFKPGDRVRIVSGGGVSRVTH